MKKPTIIYFDFITHFGGAARSNLELASHISDYATVHVVNAYGYAKDFEQAVHDAGLSYDVLCPDEQRVVIGHKGKRIRRILSAIRSIPSLNRVRSRLQQLVHKYRADIIWTSTPKALTIISLLFLPRTRVLFFMRGTFLQAHRSPRIKLLFRHRTSTFVCLSESVAKEARELGIAPECVKVVPNAVDVGRLAALAKRDLVAPLPMANKPVRILVPASILPGKGQLTAIQALALLVNEKHVDAVLYLAGDVPVGSGEAYDALLKNTAAELQIADRVYFLGWRDDIPQLIRASTCIALSSHTEGMPRCVMEAMALGRPVVATPVGAIPELLKEGDAGWLVQVKHPEQLAGAFAEISIDQNLVQNRVASAYQHIVDVYERSTQVQRFVDAMRSAFNSRLSPSERVS